MRVLFAGDTHGYTSHVINLIDTAKREECDRIFVLGDFGYWEHMREGVEFLDKVSAHAIKAHVSVYFLDGNHDKTSLLLKKYSGQINGEGFLTVRGRLFYAKRGHRWVWDGVSFIALGGAYSVDKEWRLDNERASKRPAGTLWFPEEEMTDEDMAAILRAQAGRKVDVMLAHDKPLESAPSFNRKGFEDCAPNQLRLQRAINELRPDLFLHGHLHFRYMDIIGSPSCEGTMVIGLDADPWNAGTKRWSMQSSYYVFDTEEYALAQTLMETQEPEDDDQVIEDAQ